MPCDTIALSVLMSRLKWLRTAPLGRPVVPEVYMIRAGSCSSTATVTGVSSASSNRSPRRSAPGPAAAASPSTTTARTSGNVSRTAPTSGDRPSSTTITDAPQSRRMNPTSSATRRKLTGTTMAPTRHPANIASIISMLFFISSARRSPWRSPRAMSAWARDVTRRSTSPNVRLSPLQMYAVRAGYFRAMRLSCSPWSMPRVPAMEVTARAVITRCDAGNADRSSADRVTGRLAVPRRGRNAAGAQLMLEDPPDGILRQLGGDLDIAGNGEVGEVLAAKVHERLHVDGLDRSGDQVDHHLVLSELAGHAHRRHLGHGWMAQEGLLHLERRDFLSPPAHGVLLAVGEVEKSILVEPAHVPGVEPQVLKPGN